MWCLLSGNDWNAIVDSENLWPKEMKDWVAGTAPGANGSQTVLTRGPLEPDRTVLCCYHLLTFVS